MNPVVGLRITLACGGMYQVKVTLSKANELMAARINKSIEFFRETEPVPGGITWLAEVAKIEAMHTFDLAQAQTGAPSNTTMTPPNVGPYSGLKV